MASPRVTVEFTVAEAMALWSAAGETLDHPDAVEASFPNPSKRNAAFRAYDKLAAAWMPHYRRSRNA